MFKIYGTETCQYCVLAAQLLDREGFSYTKIDLSKEENNHIKEAFLENGWRKIPQIFLSDGTHIGGHDALVTWVKSRELEGTWE